MDCLVIITFVLLYLLGGAGTTFFVAKFCHLKESAKATDLSSAEGKTLIIITFIIWPLFAASLLLEGIGIFLHVVGKAFVKLCLLITSSSNKLVTKINEDVVEADEPKIDEPKQSKNKK